MSDLEPRPASEFTEAANSAAMVNFDDHVDFAAAQRGLIAQLADGRVTQDGTTVWDVASHDFLRTDDPPPATVHPGLWRQGRLNNEAGLFQVA